MSCSDKDVYMLFQPSVLCPSHSVVKSIQWNSSLLKTCSLLTATRLEWGGNAKACFKSMTALILELWQNYQFIKLLLFCLRKGHKSSYEHFPELEMPTLDFYVLLFYDLCYHKDFQCLVALRAVQDQRFSIVNRANFVGEAMSLISPAEALGRNGQAFLNTSPSSDFCTRFETAFHTCVHFPSHIVPLALECGPKSTHNVQLATSPTYLSGTKNLSACVSHRFKVRCGVRQGESSNSCHLSASI